MRFLFLFHILELVPKGKGSGEGKGEKAGCSTHHLFSASSFVPSQGLSVC